MVGCQTDTQATASLSINRGRQTFCVEGTDR